jgi:hypothetical protein
MWLTNYGDGGYGFALNANGSGGIYHDLNNINLVMGFADGKVGIGVMPTYESNYKLLVAGGILATEVKVQLQGEWRDFVFKKGYKLRSINEVETFINQNGHLPEIPDAKTVKSDGINVGEMNALLLQKIEELTLYIIQQQKQLDMLQEKVGHMPVTTSK